LRLGVAGWARSAHDDARKYQQIDADQQPVVLRHATRGQPVAATVIILLPPPIGRSWNRFISKCVV